MYRLLHHHRRLLNAFAALLLLAAFLHCTQEWQAELHHRQIVAEHSAAGLPLPIGLPAPGCDDESGCICRGATVAQPLDVGGLNGDYATWLHLFAAEQSTEFIAEPATAVPGDYSVPPPPSGRMLRALYASLLI